jgi:glycosyltransferase involved in cell wall biosynthesis
MKILFVHEVSWFNKVVYEMHDFPELLSLNGHQVHFLDFDEGKPRARWKPVTTTETRAHKGSKVSVTTPPRILPGIFGRLLAIFIQPIIFLKLIKQIEPDVVVTYSIPTSGWQITKICRIKKIPIVLRAIDISHVLRESHFNALVKWSEGYVFKNSNFVCTHNESLRQYCIGHGAQSEKSSVIYPGIDTKRFFPSAPRKDLQATLGIRPSDSVLVFMGSIFRFSGLVELFLELTPALRNDPSLKLLILGDGEDLDRLRKLAHSNQLQSQVITPGRIEYDLLADHLCLGHVALLPFRQELVTHSALPGKILQYLACGLPTIATPLNGLLSMIAPGQGVVYAADLTKMATEAVDLAKNPHRRKTMSHLGMELMGDACNWNNQIKQFENLLMNVSNV